MKVLLISGDDDFHFLTFEHQGEFSIKEIVTTCANSENKSHTFEVEDGYFDAELFEFGEVDKKFIDFVEQLKDSDDSNHKNWIVVE